MPPPELVIVTPGIDGSGGQMLAAQDFSVAPLARSNRSDKQTYLVKLRSAVPDGRVVILRLRLSDEPGLDDPIYEYACHEGNYAMASILAGARAAEKAAEEAAKKGSK